MRYALYPNFRFSVSRALYKGLWRVGKRHENSSAGQKGQIISFSDYSYQYHHQLNSDFYAVESPDAIEPTGEGSYTVFRYSENNMSAGIAFSGNYKVCALGFPFEALCDEAERDRLMTNVLIFLKKATQ